MQRRRRIGRRAAVDAEAGTGFLRLHPRKHRGRPAAPDDQAAHIRGHAEVSRQCQKSCVFSRAVVVNTARLLMGANLGLHDVPIARFLWAAAECFIGQVQILHPCANAIEVNLRALMGGAGECELARGQAKGICGTRADQGQGLNHFGRTARQYHEGGIAPCFFDLAVRAADDGVACVDTFEEWAAPDFGEGGGSGSYWGSFQWNLWAKTCQCGFRHSRLSRYDVSCQK